MKKYLLIFFLIFFTQSIFADDKIIYIDVNKIVSNSDSGKHLNNELNKINEANINEFKNIEKKLKSEEENILKQKNILKESEFNTKVNELREKVKSYNDFKNKKNNELKNLRDNGAKKILNALNSILSEYASTNSISLIIDKKNIVIGKTELDVTNKIMDLLNKKIKKVDLEWFMTEKLDKNQIINLLPHREPMLLIDELINIKKLFSATAIVNVKKDSFFVQGHFPGNPVMPGVLIVEAFGQAAAALTAAGIDKKEYENKLVFLMSVEKARFRNPVIPDCKLELNIEAIRSHGRVWKYKGEAYVEGKKMADAQWSATIVDRK